MVQTRQRAPGAGVKASDGAKKLDRKQVRIDQVSEAILSKIGDGNLSLGIREAARRLSERGDIGPFDEARHEKRQK